LDVGPRANVLLMGQELSPRDARQWYLQSDPSSGGRIAVHQDSVPARPVHVGGRGCDADGSAQRVLKKSLVSVTLLSVRVPKTTANNLSSGARKDRFRSLMCSEQSNKGAIPVDW
jgi:hypothetical protein